MKALARIVYHSRLISADPLLPISTYSADQEITGSQVTTAIRAAALRCGLYHNGYKKEQISAHSLRAGGAMAMKLSGASDSAIKKFGRWSSDTWLTYIHSQIATLTLGLSERMATAQIFMNVGG